MRGRGKIPEVGGQDGTGVGFGTGADSGHAGGGLGGA